MMKTITKHDDDLPAYRLKITIKNNLLLGAIEKAGYKSVAEFCRAAGLSMNQVGELVGLRVRPILRSGEFSEPAVKIMEMLGACPSDLWTSQQLTMRLSRNSAERVLSSDHIQTYLRDTHNEVNALPTPEDDALKHEVSAVVAGVLNDALTSREQRIIRYRYYQDMTLDEVAELEGIGRERVRQIEQNCFRKLRKPSKARVLREAVTYESV